MRSTFLSVFLLVTASSPFLSATSVSYTGSFVNDTDVKLITASFGVASTVTFQTFSYAGGVNGAGTTIPRGGFDPLIDIFTSTGVLINENDDGAMSPIDPVTGNAFDAYLKTTLAAGTYTVALAQFDNFAIGPNLSNGFNETDPAFTAIFGCSNGRFCDAGGSNRTANWALDITSSPVTAAVPEPAIPAMLTLGLAAVGVVRRKSLNRK